LKETELWNDLEQNGLAKYWKTVRRKKKKAGKKYKGKICGKKEETGDFWPSNRRKGRRRRLRSILKDKVTST
jgi:hypothetical protein